MSKEKNKMSTVRYRGLIISVGIFVVLIISVLVVNFYGGRLTTQNMNEMETSGEMRDQIQSITRDLFDLRINYGESPFSPNISATIKRLRKNSDDLNAQLLAFQHSEEVYEHDGQNAAYKKDIFDFNYTTDPVIVQKIDEAIEEWQPLKAQIDNYLSTVYEQNVGATPLDLAIIQAQTSSISLYEVLDSVAKNIAQNAEQRSAQIGLVQITGIAFAIVYFIIFIFFFIRRLRQADIETEAARQETTEIMQTIQEGLFLIDENLQIGQQTSAKLAAIVPGRVFSGEQMEEVLQNIIDTKDIENTRRFIKQLFNERIDEQLIAGLNPLQEVKISVQQGEVFEPRYLRFIFTRVWEDDSIKRVLVSVSDVTESVRLQQRLEKERKQNEQQMELLVKILHITPTMLNSFLRNARQLTERVNDILRRPGRGSSDLKNKAREIFRDIHSFKGESAALGLNHFVDNCEIIEDRLKELQGRSNISGNDFMQVTIVLNELIERINSIENLQANLQHISEDSGSETQRADQAIRAYYAKFVEEVAARNHKTAHLEVKEYDFAAMSDQVHDQVKEIIVQLIRNAVVHGIEPGEIRQSLHKAVDGQLSLSLRDEGDAYELKFSDDGSGINYAELRNRLKQLEQNSSNPEQIDALTEQELNRYIFVSGLSTMKQGSTDAGRGVGMDVIKDRLNILGGRIALRSKPDVGTQFVIRIPHSSK